ncbi:MAG: glycoside hydrolase family 2 protein [Bacteroidales bacterium]|nr:glycoside hydrolase family 2 protein [Bacteroidales bacterium]
MKLSKYITAVALMALASGADAAVDTVKLHDGWRFRQGRADIWYPATVPGTVHTDLMANEIIEDPFFRLNERAVQWVDKEDWMYETTFTASPAQTEAENQEIVFYGLDTYANVYLNHHQILAADNMHRTWRCDVKGILKEGENLLEVYFNSPIKVDLPKYDMYDYTFNTGPDQSQNGGLFDKTLSIFARKAGYHYGWDWGPRLVTSGIWRPVELQTWSGQRIADVQYIQKNVNERKADLSTVVEIQSDSDIPAATITVTADGKQVASKTAPIAKGLNTISLDYSVASPRLWWTNGLGDPNLTEFTTTLTVGDKQVERTDHKIGLRDLQLVFHPDAQGHALYFQLNGKPVFAKGVDMIPLDNFLPRISREKYEKHVLDAKDVNMNMIRVWGGGVYEDDYFYDLCDANGILVWQDFMFACSTYPADEAFLANIRQEAIDNVKRIRNHCSIALWCGNNECQDVYYGWGNRLKYYQEKGVDSLTTKQFKDIYFRTLPEVVEQYGGGIAYRPSSPYAFEDTPSDGINGDAHYWGVWHGRDSIGHYNVEKARFFSEYGFQSFPEFESVKIYAPQERDWDINSEVMMAHQRAGSYANNLIREYMEQEFRKPDDFPTFLYVGSILQGDAIKTAVEAHRRDMPHCMGTLVWQHNDCWPVASWAGRDYYGRWKAQQYFSRAAYDDILVSPVVMGDSLTVNIVTDRRTPAKGTFTLTAMKLDGTPVASKKIKYTAQPLTSRQIYAENVYNLLGGLTKNDVIFVTSFETGDRTYGNIAYANKQKFMNYTKPELTLDITPASDGYDVTVGTDVFARGVFLSLDGIDNFFSDNYFDILPGSSRTIHVQTPLAENDFRSQLKFISMGDVHAATPLPGETSVMDNSGEFKPLGGN